MHPRAADRPQVALCADSAMAMPLAVTVRSIARRASVGVDFHLASDRLAPEHLEAIRATLQAGKDHAVHLFDLSPFRPDLAAVGAGGATYDRLLLARALAGLSRILYLDSDLLVRGDIAELWQETLRSPALLQACADPLGTITGSVVPMHAREHVALGGTYYNTGVLGMDLERWRREGIQAQLIEFLRSYGTGIPFADQCVLNARLGSRIQRLPDTFNRFALTATPDAHIVHYCTFRKPLAVPRRLNCRQDWALARWQLLSENSFHVSEYFEVLDETPYRGWRPRSPHRALLRVLPRSWVDRLRATRWQRSHPARPPIQTAPKRPLA